MFTIKIQQPTEKLSTADPLDEIKLIEKELRELKRVQDNRKSSMDGTTEAVSVSLGNPRVEIRRGVVHLFRDINEKPSTLARLPENRNCQLCVLAVPDYITSSDLCKFTGSFLTNIKEIHILRNDKLEDRYMVIMSLDSQKSADDFYRYFNGKQFSSFDSSSCCVVFVSSVEWASNLNSAMAAPPGLTELPTCTFCLERLDVHISGILTTVCNHSFHSSCISKWEDSSCPVCRYSQDQSCRTACTVCGSTSNLWMCVICGFVGCGRYEDGHSIEHWQNTGHCYSLELSSQRVWDYVGDGYVHRLIQSKTDGKLVEVSPPCMACKQGDGAEKGSSCCQHGGDCSGESELQEALINSKVGQVAEEFNHLLYTQLDNQRKYFEGLMAEAKKEQEAMVARAVEEASRQKVEKVQSRMEKVEKERDRAVKELERLRGVERDLKDAFELNVGLSSNLKDRSKKLLEAEKREKALREETGARIRELEDQVRDLMVYIEAQGSIQASGSEIRDGTVLGVSPAPGPKPRGKSGKKSRQAV